MIWFAGSEKYCCVVLDERLARHLRRHHDGSDPIQSVAMIKIDRGTTHLRNGYSRSCVSLMRLRDYTASDGNLHAARNLFLVSGCRQNRDIWYRDIEDGGCTLTNG
ncbi:MAG: hypothetical protein QOI58_1994 [Thermoanaerobaculia bacterium]|jgi:hypothetical protein|nr:hypothetical protein [Thermoanaerobaculia bacterium]